MRLNPILGFLPLAAAAGAAIGVAVIAVATAVELKRSPTSIPEASAAGAVPQVLDRHGRLLRQTYRNDRNVHDFLALEEFPDILVQAVVRAEDKRFFSHGGQDWIARAAALGQNLRSGRVVRGASTITEQVVRMIQPSRRTIWTRWIEGWQATRLERAVGKLSILEFYLNEVPFASNRRGMAQASRMYFGRSVSTLGEQEVLMLAVLIRAPSRLDPRAGFSDGLAQRMQALASDLGWESELQAMEPQILADVGLDVDASHFVRHVLGENDGTGAEIRTTLDVSLQQRTQAILQGQIESLSKRGVSHGAALVASHETGEVLAWVVAARDTNEDGAYFDSVLVPRQAGSTLKPLLYAVALQKGWGAGEPIEDEPVDEFTSRGLHAYRNYSDTFYGRVTLREALANSLNIPAVKTVRFIGVEEGVRQLRSFGFTSLDRPASEYGSGLALGNGEVSLLELVSGYAMLASRGRLRTLKTVRGDSNDPTGVQVIPAEVASMISDILSDDAARQLEFSGGFLDFPVQTAVKTGTSSDFRDAWAVGFDSRYVAGVWMGNLSRVRMEGVTGAQGPLLVLRATFDTLNRHQPSRRLWLSEELRSTETCVRFASIPEDAESGCSVRHEFEFGEAIDAPADIDQSERLNISMTMPRDGMHLALDPRIPTTQQSLEFMLEGVQETDEVEWIVDREVVSRDDGPRHQWQLSRGAHSVRTRVWRGDELVAETSDVQFRVW